MKRIVSVLAMLVATPNLMACGSEDGTNPLGGDNPLGDALDMAAEACGFECKTIAEAGGSVSGIAELDSFFTAVADFNAQANILDADVNATLGEMAAAIGVDAGADASATASLIVDEINAGFGGKIDGGISIEYEPPQCQVSAQATIEASARCDAEVTPGSASVECKGSCELDASADVSCEGEAELKCTGTAPSFACEGVLEAAQQFIQPRADGRQFIGHSFFGESMAEVS